MIKTLPAYHSLQGAEALAWVVRSYHPQPLVRKVADGPFFEHCLRNKLQFIK